MISLDTRYLVVCSWLQLPTSSHDTSVGNSSEVVEEDEPAEVSEEDDLDQVLSKEDEADEELSEEDETEEELLKEEQVQKYVLEEKLFYEDVYEEDPLDEKCATGRAIRGRCARVWLK